MVTLPNGATVYPIVTGTFGGVDFLHSVMGEFDDKATQSELQVLEGTIQDSQNSGQGQSSILRELLNKLPTGLFGSGKDAAGKADELEQNSQAAQLQQTHISPRQPEEWTRQIEEVQKQIYPILEWHDEIMQDISEAIEKIPVVS
jgi:Heterokaryon incompatibility protein Het-C